MTETRRAGLTLLELIVVLAIIGLMAGVVGLSAPSRATPPPPWETTLATARRTAIDSGRMVSVTFTIYDTLHSATAFPDGSVVADSTLPVDRLTGMWSATRDHRQ